MAAAGPATAGQNTAGSEPLRARCAARVCRQTTRFCDSSTSLARVAERRSCLTCACARSTLSVLTAVLSPKTSRGARRTICTSSPEEQASCIRCAPGDKHSRGVRDTNFSAISRFTASGTSTLGNVSNKLYGADEYLFVKWWTSPVCWRIKAARVRSRTRCEAKPTPMQSSKSQLEQSARKESACWTSWSSARPMTVSVGLTKSSKEARFTFFPRDRPNTA